MKKRLFNLFLAIVMVLGMFPIGVMAGETDNSDVVYLSVSFDGKYIEDQQGAPMAFIPVNFDTVAAVDLEEYGLGEYQYDSNGDGTYEITALHLVIYAHEILYGGNWSDVTFTGTPGSSYFAGGIFGFSENLNYYLNGTYPNTDGWGTTSDQIVLQAGDYLDIASFSSFSFYSDPNYGFHFFADAEGNFIHDYTAVAGEPTSVKLVRSYSGMGEEPAVYAEENYSVSYGTELYGTESSKVTTGADGTATITFAEAGTYYLWADGAYGTEPDMMTGEPCVVSSPAYAKIVVSEAEEEDEPVPFSSEIKLPSNGNSSWGYVSKLVLNGTDGGIYEAYWSSAKDPFVVDVILTQDTDPDAQITATFSVAGLRAPSIVGETTAAMSEGKGTIQVTAKSGSSFYPDSIWTINLTVDDGSAANRPAYEVNLPTDTEGYMVSAYNSESPVIEGREFSFKVTIDGEYKKSEEFRVLTNGVEIAPSGDVYTIENITEAQTVTVEGVVKKTLADKNVTIIAPAGSTISSGKFYSYFKYDFNEPLEKTTLEDGRVSWVFPVPASQGFLRVQHPDGVTYWDFDDLTAGSVFEITSEMLFIGSDEFTKETVYANFEKNIKDKADLYMTVNPQGWLDLDTGDVHSLNIFRNFLSLGNSISNNSVALPDVEYKVISADGTPSDVVKVIPNTNNSSFAEIQAVKAGTAIILVSYDAVYNNDGEGGKQWSAIWPENTGVIVVTVDANDADIATNMTVNETANAGGKQIMDTEHDILFYVDEAGAEFSFKPEDGCTVSVARSTVGETMTFKGFETEGVSTAEDGTVTVSGLTTGAHIIKVEKGEDAAYQVIRTRKVSYELLHSDGTAVNAEKPAQPGETITVQFHGLISPLEKLSGVYNANFGFYYNGKGGMEIRTSGGTYGSYTFSGSPALQKFSVTIPSYWNESTLTLTDGGIKLGGFGGSFGAHRSKSYLEGAQVNNNASGTAGVASVLPDILIPTQPTGINVYWVTLPEGEGYTVTPAEGSSSPVTEGGSYTFSVAVMGGYDGNDMTVKVNDQPVTLTDGSYTVENVTCALNVTVEGVAKVTVEIPEETTAIYTNGKDGSNWSDGYVYVDTVCVGGKGVVVENYTWDGDVCTIDLGENTPIDATIVFTMTIDGEILNWFKGATLNGTVMSPDLPCSVTLVDGAATAEMTATCRGNTTAKTFIFTGAQGGTTKPEPIMYTVELPAETDKYTVTAAEGSASPVMDGGSYSFTVTIADGYEASENFAVKANNAVLTAVDGVYTISGIHANQVVIVEGVVEKQEPATRTWQQVMEKTQEYLTHQAQESTPDVASTNGEWLVLGLARNGVTGDFLDDYYSKAVAHIQENIDANGRLHPQKSTDNSRVILALTALGKDVTDVGGYNLLQGLTDTVYVPYQGINGAVFALIALDSGDYEIPANTNTDRQVTREWLINYILEKQLTNGGWALDGQNIDDMTPMAIQALAPYYKTNRAAKTAVDKALIVMQSMNATTETYAQMIVALSALGIDCETDERFDDTMDKMLSFALEDGSFEKGKGSGANQMSTEQAFYAMVAYSRFLNKQTSLYDMTDVITKEQKYTITVTLVTNGMVTASAEQAIAGADITLTVEPAIGYELKNLTVKDAAGNAVAVTGNKFTMPASNVTVTAAFAKTEDPAQHVIDAIDALTVTKADKATQQKIREIKAAYEALSVEERANVTNYSALEAAAAAFDLLLNAAKNDAANELEDLFDALKEEDYTRENWEKVQALRNKALADVEKAENTEAISAIVKQAKTDLDKIATGSEITVSFRLIGDGQHDNGVSDHEEYVTWIPTTTYKLKPGATMYDVFMEAMADYGLSQRGASNNYVESIKAPSCLGGYWLGEFDNGPNSGWMYTVNGDHPGTGLKTFDLTDGDRIIWHYVDDYVQEERTGSSKYYYRWLEARDIAPETYVKEKVGKILTVGEHGKVEPAEIKLSDIGRDITFTFKPDAGYVVKDVIIDGESKGSISTYTYKNLRYDSRIEVKFAKAGELFDDVKTGDWFYDDVMFVVEEGLFNGTGENKFSPNASMNRVMLVTVLYRLEGAPKVTGSSKFGDVAIGQWYTDAVIWATQNEIVNGYGNGKFGPTDNITREQMATILFRYAQFRKYDTSASNTLTGYNDFSSISVFSLKAMKWANAEGLISGRTATTLAPQGTATRAEVAAILHRFVENVVND